MNSILTLTPSQRAELYQAASQKLGIGEIIIEKDFWVCWTLKHVFSLPIAPHLLFKGGTSLSKVFGVIQRFSEDIDLSIHRDYLGFGGDQDPIQLPSVSKREAQIEKLVEASIATIRAELLPQLRRSFGAVLGAEVTPSALAATGLGGPSVLNWRLGIDPADPQTLLFAYPDAINPSVAGAPRTSYVAPVVRLEMGARSDPYPTGTYDVTSYAAEEYPDPFQNPTCAVHVLEAQRTFWEKATILHAECHRPDSTRTTGRLSRHYYDRAQLAVSDIAEKALADMSLLERVAIHKKVFFRAGWAKYDEARPGTLRLVPPAAKQDALRRDYVSMSEMFFGEQPSFDEIMNALQIVEDRINS